MTEARLTEHDLNVALDLDRLHVVPVLILLHAIDRDFPTGESWLWPYVTRRSDGYLLVDFDEIRQQPAASDSTAALVDLGHDLWNRGSKTQMKEVLNRCDTRRLELVIRAVRAIAERGRGEDETWVRLELLAGMN